MSRKSRKRNRRVTGPVTMFQCFACKESFTRKAIKNSGKRKNGSTWYVCVYCSESYKAHQKMDQQAYEAAQADRILTDTGYEEMGWNGVPSERSLRRRQQ